MSESAKGVSAMVLACLIWGLSPLYYKALVHVPPLEVLSHRTLWSAVLFGVLIALQGRLGALWDLLRQARALLFVVIAALMISANWFLFILSIQLERAVEASLGYYIFPLVAVLLGALVFREKLSRLQWGAVALATLAVGLLWGLGITPLISLTLAVTFGVYGLIKKTLKAGPVVSVTAEVLLLSPLALVWLWGVHWKGWGGLLGRNVGAFGGNFSDTLLLVLSGPITALPLILFSYASKRASYATIGLVQYLNPTLQGAVAVLVFREVFTGWHLAAFALIWAGLALYSFEAFRHAPLAKKPAPQA